ncbi:hypothetical protein BLOT_011763 [Blomia tropicalis]|nr:hypothetical protein BLOT_011763 [Blomia tropicalis]
MVLLMTNGLIRRLFLVSIDRSLPPTPSPYERIRCCCARMYFSCRRAITVLKYVSYSRWHRVRYGSKRYSHSSNSDKSTSPMYNIGNGFESIIG